MYQGVSREYVLPILVCRICSAIRKRLAKFPMHYCHILSERIWIEPMNTYKAADA